MSLLNLIASLSSVAFLYYGIACLTSIKMRAEFARFGLSDISRKITGITQICGSISLIIGLSIAWIGFFGALGLTLQMALGVLVRVRVGDKFVLLLPALLLTALNAYIAVLFFLK